MPNFCSVVGCGSRGNRDYHRAFFRIPANPSRGSEEFIRLTKERRQKWIAALKRADLTDTKLKNGRICDKHFITGRPADLLDYLNPDWIPSKLMGDNVPTNRNTNRKEKVRLEASSSEVEYKMPIYVNDGIGSTLPIISHVTSVEVESSVVKVKSEVVEEECEVDVSVCDFPKQVYLTDEQCCVGTQTDLTMEDINKMSSVINQQMKEIGKLKEKLSHYVVNEESFKDDRKTKFYTGLENFQVLMLLFNLISKDLNESPLTKFQQLVLTLQRLRLNLSITDLAYRYNITVNTASKAFQTCLYVLYKKLERFIAWPEIEVLRKTMPSVFFDTFGKNMLWIIDCLEIKIEMPSNLVSSNHVWSNYKLYHHTAKFIIGICPQGAVTFVSSKYDGRTSDKELVLNCGILEKLLPGDIVLSDWGFLVCDEVGQSTEGAEVQMPCFTKGTKQLLPYNVEENTKILDIREKVIRNLRQKYQILQSVLPNHVLKTQTYGDAPLLNQIVFVCCALINICPTVVPLQGSIHTKIGALVLPLPKIPTP